MRFKVILVAFLFLSFWAVVGNTYAQVTGTLRVSLIIISEEEYEKQQRIEAALPLSTVTFPAINVFATPTVSERIIYQAKFGEEMRVIEQREDWALVKFVSSEKTGFIWVGAITQPKKPGETTEKKDDK